MKSMKNRGVVVGILIALLLALPGLSCAESGASSNSERSYQSAEQLLSSGRYQEAYRLFSELGSYQESVKYVLYLEGILAAYAGALSEAELNFTVLSNKGFLDSAELLQYVEARKAETQGQLAEALKTYQKIDVLDSVMREVIVLGLLKEEELKKAGSGTGGSEISFFTPLPQRTPVPTPKTTPRPTVKPTATESPYVGTVIIQKSGYMSVRKRDSSSSEIIFRVHYGERYLCLSADGYGWYAILLPDGNVGYVTSDPDSTYLDRGATSKTLSIVESEFMVRATGSQNYVYSQPKKSAQTRRVSGDGTETTFYFNKDALLACYGKTTRNNQVWYLLQPIYVGESVCEIVWLPADNCTVVSGDPDDNIIPSWWYD
ncbi:MAG TPA: SH3 domain-containing protein [Clostridia bacterium]|nr:SH3 domain-containing protein [Clostridia bacterium]